MYEALYIAGNYNRTS